MKYTLQDAQFDSIRHQNRFIITDFNNLEIKPRKSVE